MHWFLPHKRETGVFQLKMPFIASSGSESYQSGALDNSHWRAHPRNGPHTPGGQRHTTQTSPHYPSTHPPTLPRLFPSLPLWSAATCCGIPPLILVTLQINHIILPSHAFHSCEISVAVLWDLKISCVLWLDFAFWDFSTPPRHVGSCGKILDPSKSAPGDLWKHLIDFLPTCHKSHHDHLNSVRSMHFGLFFLCDLYSRCRLD